MGARAFGLGAAVHLQSLRGFSHTQAALCVAVFSLAPFCSLPLLRALQRGAHELHDCGAGFGRCLARLQQLPCARMRSAKVGRVRPVAHIQRGVGPTRMVRTCATVKRPTLSETMASPSPPLATANVWTDSAAYGEIRRA